MSSVNRVILVGNLGADPESRAFADGTAVCNIRLATTERWRDRESGESREATEWHRVVFYRRLAEIAAEYLQKGAQIYIEGRLRTRKWVDKAGVERYNTEIEADDLKMLGKKAGGAATVTAAVTATGNAPQGAAPARAVPATMPTIAPRQPDPVWDDVPPF